MSDLTDGQKALIDKVWPLKPMTEYPPLMLMEEFSGTTERVFVHFDNGDCRQGFYDTGLGWLFPDGEWLRTLGYWERNRSTKAKGWRQ